MLGYDTSDLAGGDLRGLLWVLSFRDQRYPMAPMPLIYVVPQSLKTQVLFSFALGLFFFLFMLFLLVAFRFE